MNQTVEERIKQVEASPLAKGKNEYLKYLKGGVVSRREAMLAQCYICCGYFSDGKYDCKILMCPMYHYMPYKEGGARKTKTMSEEQKKQRGETFKKVRDKKKKEMEDLRRRR